MKFLNPDPYVLRFSNIGFRKQKKTDNWLAIPPPTIKISDPLFRDSIKVILESIFDDAEIYYTLNGSEPTGNSFQYSGPFNLKKSTIVKARLIERKGSESEVCKVFFRSRYERFQASNMSNLKRGLQYSYYEGNWRYLPDFENLSALKNGKISAFDINEIKEREDNFAIRFKGYIDIPSDGEYTFYSSSDDGSKIWINGFPIVDNDGTHGMIEASGDVILEKGKHKIEVQYFENVLGQDMQISYKGPGIRKTEIPGSVLYSKNE
jgi:hypothetical protein